MQEAQGQSGDPCPSSASSAIMRKKSRAQKREQHQWLGQHQAIPRLLLEQSNLSDTQSVKLFNDSVPHTLKSNLLHFTYAIFLSFGFHSGAKTGS